MILLILGLIVDASFFPWQTYDVYQGSRDSCTFTAWGLLCCRLADIPADREGQILRCFGSFTTRRRKIATPIVTNMPIAGEQNAKVLEMYGYLVVFLTLSFCCFSFSKVPHTLDSKVFFRLSMIFSMDFPTMEQIPRHEMVKPRQVRTTRRWRRWSTSRPKGCHPEGRYRNMMCIYTVCWHTQSRNTLMNFMFFQTLAFQDGWATGDQLRPMNPRRWRQKSIVLMRLGVVLPKSWTKTWWFVLLQGPFSSADGDSGMKRGGLEVKCIGSHLIVSCTVRWCGIV